MVKIDLTKKEIENIIADTLCPLSSIQYYSSGGARVTLKNIHLKKRQQFNEDISDEDFELSKSILIKCREALKK